MSLHFSDLGIRRIAANEGTELPLKYLGLLFEQFIGLELSHLESLGYGKNRLYFWRDVNGPEVDWVLVKENEIIPIEVKWTDNPTLQDAKHLQLFCNEYKNAKVSYIICRTAYKTKLSDNIIAWPWQEIDDLFKG